MAHVQRVQKKSSSLSLTIASSSSASSTRELSSSSSSSSTIIASRHSSLVQQPCVSPQRTESPIYDEHSGSGVAATFVKCLHDVCALKGQLVVLECRLKGTPPPQVTWYREDQQILDCEDFRILRKKASSASVPEELCTLVITEAFPEDSGVFKCVAHNSFGTVSCSAMLDVYNDIEEQLEIEAIRQQEAECFVESNEAEFQLESAPLNACEDFPTVLPDSVIVPLPDWPSSSLEDVSTSEVGRACELGVTCLLLLLGCRRQFLKETDTFTSSLPQTQRPKDVFQDINQEAIMEFIGIYVVACLTQSGAVFSELRGPSATRGRSLFGQPSPSIFTSTSCASQRKSPNTQTLHSKQADFQCKK
ncbi:uncharacterized protein LOC144059523 [Vanacampus margaritifer]